MSRVLIIDDEEMVRFTARQMLEAEGHEVVEAVNGRDGITKFNEVKPDLVITDIIMPDQEGIETIGMLRKTNPSIPIIAISGGGRVKNLDFLEIAERIGANLALAKPFSRSDLVESVKKLLN